MSSAHQPPSRRRLLVRRAEIVLFPADGAARATAERDQSNRPSLAQEMIRAGDRRTLPQSARSLGRAVARREVADGLAAAIALGAPSGVSGILRKRSRMSFVQPVGVSELRALRIAGNSNFNAASSVGKLPRVLMILRRCDAGSQRHSSCRSPCGSLGKRTAARRTPRPGAGPGQSRDTLAPPALKAIQLGGRSLGRFGPIDCL